MTQDNGTTQKIDGRHKDCQYPHQRRRLGGVQISSRCNGAEQIGTDSPSCSRQDSTGATLNRGQTPAGKILERLEFIESAYFSYVDGHQQRLEARLSESREQKEAFKKAVQELKQEIYDLVSTAEQTEESS